MTPPPIALTVGDPNGIGPDIAIKAAARLAREGGPPVVLVGDEFVLRFYAELCAKTFSLRRLDGQGGGPDTLQFLAVDALPRDAFHPGTPLAAGGRATVEYVAAAMRLVTEGHATAIVACPHSETNVNAAGIPFSGYPSLLARLMEVPEDEVFLMLVGGGLRIVHVTLHERLQTALARITPELVERATRTAEVALRKLNVERPRIGLFGINPHAGEGGLFGDDDVRITVPAAKRLQASGLDVVGPLGADLMLGKGGFDAFVAMYHDQGHIPVKLLAGRNSAALSIGAGLLFSSVGHGSAFDIPSRAELRPGAVSGQTDDYRWTIDVSPLGGGWTVPDADVPWVPELVRVRVRSPSGAVSDIRTVRLMQRPSE